MAEDNDDEVITCLESETHSDDEIYKTARTRFISPALREELLRTRLSYANFGEIGPIHAKTLPARHRKSDSDSERWSRRYSASARVDDIILNSLLEHDEVDNKTLPRKSIRHLHGKLSFKKQLW